MLIGRGSECEELLALLERTRKGAGCGRVLRGPPGVGKTTLLSWSVQQAGDLELSRSNVTNRQDPLPLSALRDLVEPIEAEIERLLPEHRRTLLGMLGRESSVADSKGLGAAVVALFSLLAERSPLLVVIDDLHWADTTSLEAISFANRRLDHERALILAAVHDGEFDPIESMPTFVVAGLSPFEVARLLKVSSNPEIAEE